MQSKTLTWPTTAQTIQTSAEAVTNQISTETNSAVAKLTAIQSDAGYSQHPLSAEANALSGLRDDLNSLLNNGTIISATPYQFEVGEQQTTGFYLNPQTAINVLTNKLRDHVDKNRPTGTLYCIAIMISESTLNSFATKLNSITEKLPIPDWCQTARQASALTTNETDKLYQSATIAQPRFKPLANLNANPLRDYLKHQGAQIATLESLANDNTNVIQKLQVLATKRATKLSEISTAINDLKSINASVYSIAINGTAESIATQLKQATLPNNHQYTIASLLISNTSMQFFEELLC